MLVHLSDCPTDPGCAHFCSCICEGIALCHSGTRLLSESVAACAGYMLPGGIERKDLFDLITAYIVSQQLKQLNDISHTWKKVRFSVTISIEIKSFVVTSVRIDIMSCILCHRRLCRTSVWSEWGSLLGWILAERSSVNHDPLLQNRCATDILPVIVHRTGSSVLRPRLNINPRALTN